MPLTIIFAIFKSIEAIGWILIIILSSLVAALI